MKPTLAFAALASIALCFNACKKEEATKKDCEQNKYGMVKFNYAVTTYRHSLIATPAASISAREKITAVGVNSDTLHLSPGTFTISYSSLDANGAAIDQDNKTVIIDQCSEENITVNF